MPEPAVGADAEARQQDCARVPLQLGTDSVSASECCKETIDEAVRVETELAERQFDGVSRRGPPSDYFVRRLEFGKRKWSQHIEQFPGDDPRARWGSPYWRQWYSNHVFDQNPDDPDEEVLTSVDEEDESRVVLPPTEEPGEGETRRVKEVRFEEVKTHNEQVAKILETLGTSGAGRRAVLRAVAERQG